MVKATDDRGHLAKAVFIDVDGTLASAYKDGKRTLRPSALPAIKHLAANAPVFLWSIAGADNAQRLIDEFPKLKPYIAGCYFKEEAPLDVIDYAYCIDDEAVDDVVLRCNHVILHDVYDGGEDSAVLMEAAKVIVDHMATI